MKEQRKAVGYNSAQGSVIGLQAFVEFGCHLKVHCSNIATPPPCLRSVAGPFSIPSPRPAPPRSFRPHAIIKEVNAVPYDANAGWKKGDVLPGRLLSRTGSQGSASDNNDAKGVWKDGVWTVTWSRPLNTGHSADDKNFKAGGVYNVSFAVHDDNVTTRFHFVSFPMTLGISAKADLEAVKVN